MSVPKKIQKNKMYLIKNTAVLIVSLFLCVSCEKIESYILEYSNVSLEDLIIESSEPFLNGECDSGLFLNERNMTKQQCEEAINKNKVSCKAELADLAKDADPNKENMSHLTKKYMKCVKKYTKPEFKIVDFTFRLPDRTVLIIGKKKPIQKSPSGDLIPFSLLYNPANHHFEKINAIPNFSRIYGYVTTMSNDGDPLIAGTRVSRGQKSEGYIERYDAQKKTWEKIGDLPRSKYSDAVTLLDGRVLLTTGNGSEGGILIWNPNNNKTIKVGHSWMKGGGSPQATRLNNGEVLITHHEYDTYFEPVLIDGKKSGVSIKYKLSESVNEYSSNAFLFDPISNRTKALPKMRQNRHAHKATLLHDGNVLITGELSSDIPAATANAIKAFSAEIYDHQKRRFIDTGDMIVPRVFHRSVRLPDNRVLVFDGFSENKSVNPNPKFELYDPGAGLFTPVDDAPSRIIVRSSLKSPNMRNGALLLNFSNDEAAFFSNKGILFFHLKEKSWRLERIWNWK